MSDQAPRIAIVGMAGRFPGAQNTAEFWANLLAGDESITRFSADELRPNEPDLDALLARGDFVAARGVLDDIDGFDADFFGLSPREAEILDPQQRLWLEACWAALEQAGIDPARFDGPIGVYAGTGYMEQYLLSNLLRDRATVDDLVKLRAADSLAIKFANDTDYLPTRTAFKLGLRGPAVNVQTACSTALVALHMGCQSLLAYENDVVLAGAVAIDIPQARGFIAQEGAMFSQDGHCRPFDAQAQGTVFSNGLGVFALKRFDDAVDDGDDILAVIRGSAVNNDGSDKMSFVAPSPAGQADVIAMAQAVADVHPDEIGYVEAHGTATPLGDPIEIDGLTQAWRRKSTATGQVRIGSVKSNIGHLDAAAGAAGLVKLVYALQSGKLPATLHYSAPNPRIDFAESPFKVVDSLTDWPSDGKPRIAGISSFGVGGTNAHLVVEQAPERPAASPSVRQPQLLVLSAKTPTALVQRCIDLADWLADHAEAPLADVAWTLATGRAEMARRVSVVASTPAEAAEALRKLAKQAERVAPIHTSQPPVGLLFPGQGAQHPGMARGLYEHEPTFRAVIDRLAGYLEPELGVDIRTVIYPQSPSDAADEQLRNTGMAQPAIFVVSYALAKLWQAWGIKPDGMLGHSVGEYVAACLSGVLSEQDCCTVLAQRAKLMADMPGGSMLAIRQSADDVQALLGDGIELAAINGPGLCIVSGPDDVMDALAKRLDAEGEAGIRLHTSHAFHSAMMEPALPLFAQAFDGVSLNPPHTPFVSCLTGDWISEADATSADYWGKQLRHTVRFSPALGALLQDPSRVFVECGPSQNLTTAVRQHKTADHAPVCVPSQAHASADSDALVAMLEALGSLWQAGVTPDWSAVFATEQHRCRREALPTYPFEHQSCWVDAPGEVAAASYAPAAAYTDLPPSAPTPSPEPVMTPADRTAQIKDRLRAIFLDLSGTDIGPGDEALSFPELGMDSLFLTQAAAEISSAFKIQLRFRQLLEDVNSLAALADYLDDLLPADQFATSTAPAVTVAAPIGSAATAAPAPAGSMQAVIDQQLEIMRQQLAVLGGSAPAPAALAAEATNNASPQIALGEREQGKNLATAGGGRFGPYKTVSRERDAALKPEQQKFLDDLIADLTSKTRSSKAVAAKSRQFIADPRSVANFRLTWKELVYQIVAQQTDGAHMTDIDGNDYVDITMGFGVGFMGHRHPVVVEAVEAQLKKGFEVGPQTPWAPIAAEKFCKITGHDRVTFCNTGSEGVMAALRCARTVTNRQKVVYFTGDYHGVFDEVLARANVVKGNLSTRPAAPGIPQDAVDNAIILDYGTDASLDIIREHAHEIAAVLVEPVQSRYLQLQPSKFVHELRKITADAGCALIMDEVITGFRTALGGLKELWEIEPDMCCYGKILGGGLPIGALGGKAKWLDAIDGGHWEYGDDSLPEAPVTFFAGTFVRHPLAMAAANAVLDFLGEDGGQLQRDLNARTAAFADDLNSHFETVGAPIRIRQCSSWFRFDFPQDQPYINLLFYWMVTQGVYIREAAQNYFFSIAHSDADIKRVSDAVKSGIAALQAVGLVASGGQPEEAPRTQPAPIAQPESSAPSGALAVGESIDLTEPQREVWLSQAVSPESAPANNEPFYLDLEGDLDIEQFRAAVQHVYERHEALHLRVAEDGERQTRVAAAKLDIPLHDSSGEADPRAAAMTAIGALSTQVFDLAAGPTLRLGVFKLAPRRHLAAFAIHHISCDGWSAVNFLKEVGMAYSALKQGHAPELPELQPFSPYARALIERMADASSQRAHWKQALANPPDCLALPTDRPRPDIKTFAGATHNATLAADTLASVKRLAADLKVTPYSVMLAAFQALMARLAGQDDVLVGIPVAGQALEGQSELFGHCAQTLPVRAQLDANTSFKDLVVQARDGVRAAYSNADMRFGSILQDLNIKRDASRLPLVEVNFNLDPAADEVQFAGLDVALHQTPKAFVNWDLFFNLTLGKSALKLDCDYNSDLFDADTIAQWAQLFETILEQVTGAPDTAIHALKLIDAQAERAQVDDFNPPPLAFDAEADVGALFKQCAADHAHDTAIFHASGPVTYAELDLQSDAVAAALAAAGVNVGDRVGVSMQRTPALLAAMLGVFKAGAAVVPLDPGYPAARLVFMAEDAGLALSLVDDSADLPGKTLPIAQAMAHTGQPPQPGPGGAREAYVLYTSGSTGKPKGVPILQRNLLALLAWGHDQFDPADFAGMLGSTSVGFDIAMFENFAPLTCGGAVVLVENVIALTQPETLPGAVTWVHTVPSPLAEVLRAVRLPDSVRVVSTVGEPLTSKLVDLAYDKSNADRVYDLYGPTEATVYATAALRTRGADETIGKPIAGWRCYILDEQGKLAPTGATGELVIGGAGVAVGYHNRPDKTAEHFVPDPFVGGDARMYKTGDLARWRPDGQLEYVGRADTQVKVRGFRIELGEIECVLREHPAVVQAVVRVFDSAEGDAQLVAYWQLADTTEATPTAAELRRFCHSKLPMHMVPQQLLQIEQWPQTPNGKLDRKALPNPFEQAKPSAATADHGKAHLEAIQSIWSELLGAPVEAQPQDSFLDLGGHSFLAVRSVQAVRKQHGVEIPVRAMMLESLAQLAARLAAPNPNPPTSGEANAVAAPVVKQGLAARLGFGRDKS